MSRRIELTARYDPPMLSMFDAIGVGELAGLGTALCWVFTSIAFAEAGRRIGSSRVNMIRLVLASFVLMGMHWVVFGRPIPEVETTGLWLLVISGLVGLAVGDQLLFTALVDIGPRLSTLLMTLAPPVTAIIAWPVLDEPLGWVGVLGIIITMSGIAWVVRERDEPDASRVQRYRPKSRRHKVRGIVFGALAAMGQAIGFVLSKLGMGHTRLPVDELLPTLSTTVVRMLAGTAGMVIILALMRIWRTQREIDQQMEVSPEQETLELAAGGSGEGGAPVKQRSVWPVALMFTGIGAVFGPVLGVWLSMVAVDRAAAGVAATLMALSPVLILPLAVLVEKQRLTWRAVLGACIAVAGVVVLTVL